MRLFCVLLLATGCAHSPLSASALDRVEKPAFVSRIAPGAGAKSSVFSNDGSYKDKLKTLSATEADKRLSEKLTNGAEDTAGNKVPSMNRFQIADTLRSHTLARLPKDPPWTNAAKPGDVAAALQSFLVQEEGAGAPDYEQLRPMGVDAIIEFVVEEYGMTSANGRAGVYVVGHGRMFTMGGSSLWYRSFRADQVESGQAQLDPFKVAKDPALFKTEMTAILRAVAEVFANDLNPPGRRNSSPPPAATEKKDDETKPAETKPAEKPKSDDPI